MSRWQPPSASTSPAPWGWRPAAPPPWRGAARRPPPPLVLPPVAPAAMAGPAGTLYAHYVRIVDPDVFLFIYTVTMVIMVVTGGKGTLAGPVVGGPGLRRLAG